MMLHNSSSSSSMSSQQFSQSMTGGFGQDAFCDIMPSSFPPGTDHKVIDCYNQIDRDGNGIIDDQELKVVLSNCSHKFSMRTVHLLMYQFTHSSKRMLEHWMHIFVNVLAVVYFIVFVLRDKTKLAGCMRLVLRYWLCRVRSIK